MVLVPTRNLNWNVGSVARHVTLRGIVVVETRRITRMSVVRERGLRTNPKTKIDAITWWIDSGATTYVYKDHCWFKTYERWKTGLSSTWVMIISPLFMEKELWVVVRLSDPKGKSLGKKGIDCIFVGYAEHFNAYRFYVIEPNDSVSINTIIESKDAIFDENCFSSIPIPKNIIPNSDESQRDGHLNDVPMRLPNLRRILEPKIKLCNLEMLLYGKKKLMMRLVLLWKIIHESYLIYLHAANL
nr:zinc finger, CCHC-type [Tanacetum cinerariifolium]